MMGKGAAGQARIDEDYGLLVLSCVKIGSSLQTQ
jgi:hypothetical protein